MMISATYKLMITGIVIPIYIALWLIAVHIQYLMRHEKKQDKIWIYPVFMLITVGIVSLIQLWRH